MTPEQFVYWLQGFVEIREKQEVGLTEREWDIIKDHLQTVFKKETPDRTGGTITITPTNPYMPNGTGEWNIAHIPPVPPGTTIC